MKHGVAFRSLSRPTAHRMLMLRNLVTSLFEHEQIKTTLPKARETARLAEKVITWGKKADRGSKARASAFLLKQEVLPKVFDTFARRYSERPGGYTRIHKYGNRPGDNAPVAILELVDNPRDLRWEMTARAVGRELLKEQLGSQRPQKIINTGLQTAQEVVEKERRLGFSDASGVLRPKTRWNLQKILKFRSESAPLEFSQKVGHYVDHLLAAPLASQQVEGKMLGFKPQVGQVEPGDTRGALHLARGALGGRNPSSRGGRKPPSQDFVLNSRSIFGHRDKHP